MSPTSILSSRSATLQRFKLGDSGYRAANTPGFQDDAMKNAVKRFKKSGSDTDGCMYSQNQVTQRVLWPQQHSIVLVSFKS